MRRIRLILLLLLRGLPIFCLPAAVSPAEATPPTPPPVCVPETIGVFESFLHCSDYPRVFPDVKIERVEALTGISDFMNVASRVEDRHRYIVSDQIVAERLAHCPSWSCGLTISFRYGVDTWRVRTVMNYHDERIEFSISPDHIRKTLLELHTTNFGDGLTITPASTTIHAYSEDYFQFEYLTVKVDDSYPIQHKEWRVPVAGVRRVSDTIRMKAERLNQNPLISALCRALEIPPGTPFTNDAIDRWNIHNRNGGIIVWDGAVDGGIEVYAYRHFDRLAILPLMSEVLSCPPVVQLLRDESLNNLTYELGHDGSVSVKINPYGLVNLSERTQATLELDPAARVITYKPVGRLNPQPEATYPFTENRSDTAIRIPTPPSL